MLTSYFANKLVHSREEAIPIIRTNAMLKSPSHFAPVFFWITPIRKAVSIAVAITKMLMKLVVAWMGRNTHIIASMKQPLMMGPKPPALPILAVPVMMVLPNRVMVTIPAIMPIDITNITAPKVCASEVAA